VALSATIARYVVATVSRRPEPEVQVHSLDYRTTSTFSIHGDPLYDGNLDLVKAVVHRVDPSWRCGLRVQLESDAVAGSGLGASSAVVVATILAVARVLGVHVGSRQAAELAYRVERHDLRIAGGYQDQYAAAFGGVNWMEFGPGGRTSVEPVAVPPVTLAELECRLLLWYVGRTHISGGILEQQIRNYEARKASTVRALDEAKAIAQDLRRALTRGRLDDFGSLLHDAWLAKRQFATDVSAPDIDHLYEAARAAGAIGGKILGAGGGGYLMLYVPDDCRAAVLAALERAGGRRGSPLRFDGRGPRTWWAGGEPAGRPRGFIGE
jgi:D-glycero-alpha-D-manno-heptose-7-phosphate kinase